MITFKYIMEKPLTKKQFGTSVKQKIILGIVSIIIVLGSTYLKKRFSKDDSNLTTNSIVLKIDSSPINLSKNNNTTQINAGRDAYIDKKIIHANGNVFLDSAKQTNSYHTEIKINKPSPKIEVNGSAFLIPLNKLIITIAK